MTSNVDILPKEPATHSVLAIRARIWQKQSAESWHVLLASRL